MHVHVVCRFRAALVVDAALAAAAPAAASLSSLAARSGPMHWARREMYMRWYESWFKQAAQLLLQVCPCATSCPLGWCGVWRTQLAFVAAVGAFAYYHHTRGSGAAGSSSGDDSDPLEAQYRLHQPAGDEGGAAGEPHSPDIDRYDPADLQA